MIALARVILLARSSILNKNHKNLLLSDLPPSVLYNMIILFDSVQTPVVLQGIKLI